MKALIIGAGIGGLTAALCLHRIGWKVEIFEAVGKLKPLGVGINLLPHGASVLHNLGLGDDLENTGIRTRAIAYRTRFGQTIMSDPRGVEAGFDFPQYSIHRGQLQFLLLDAVIQRLGPGSVHCGKRFSTLRQTTSCVEASFETAGGTKSVAGDVLIGADGFHSTVRKFLHPDEGPAHYEGTMMWRGARLQADFGDGRTMVIAGNHDIKLVYYPIGRATDGSARALINWVAEVRQSRPRAAEKADWTAISGREFIGNFQDFTMPDLDPVALMEATDAITEFPMIDRDPLSQWTQGRVTLLGDAAHPMYPIGANGASQAVLDGAALAKALASQPDPQSGLVAYEMERRPVTAKVVLANRQSGPERVLDIADERVRGPQDRVEDLITPEELDAIARDYRNIAGFQKTSERRS